MPKWAAVSWTLTKNGSIIWKLRSWICPPLFVSPIKYMLIQNLKCLCEWISIQSRQRWMSEPLLFGRPTQLDNEVRWHWDEDDELQNLFFFFSFCLSSFSLRATLRIKMFYLQVYLNLRMSLQVRQFNVCIDLKIWHLLRFFFLISSLLISIDLCGIFHRSLHNSCLL